MSGADPVTDRPGFKAMLDRIAGNGVRMILVESPDRFARDLAVQLAGHDYLKQLGVELVPTSAPDFFTTTPRPRCWCARCSARSRSSRRPAWWPSSRRRAIARGRRVAMPMALRLRARGSGGRCRGA